MSGARNSTALASGPALPDGSRHDDELNKVRADRDQLRAVLNGIPNGILLWNSRHELEFANPAAANRLGYESVDELLQTPVAELQNPFQVLDDSGKPISFDRITSVEAQHEHDTTETFVSYRVRASGKEYWTHVQSRAIGETDDGGRSVVTILRDVTELKEQEIALRFMSEATATLFASLDYEETLSRLAEAIVPHLADWCIIHVLDDDRTVSHSVVAHRDPAKVAWARELQKNHHPDINAPRGVGRVLRTGETLVMPEFVVDERLAESLGPERMRILQILDPKSLIIAPMSARGRVIGAMTMIRCENTKPFSPQNVKYVEDLATRSAVAVDNARLYREALEHQARAERDAQRLQRLTVSSIRINDGRSLCEVINSIADEAREITGSDVVVASLFDTDVNLEPLVARSASDDYAAWSEVDLVPLLRECTTFCRDGGRSLRRDSDELRSLPALRSFFETTANLPPITELMTAPMTSRIGTQVGLIIVAKGTHGAFSPDDEHVLAQLALVSAVAVDNVRLLERANDSVRIRDEFLSIAAHELKTPMTSVKGYMQLLARLLDRENINYDQVRKSAVNVQEQVNRLESLLNDLLDASRIQHHRVDLNLEPVDLCELVNLVAGRFEISPERSSQHSLELHGSAPVIGLWDRERLDQVLTNLISNAFKYSPDGGVVRIFVDSEDCDAVIRVVDQGIGISLQDQSRLFEPFTRSATARKTAGGTGLGLYISKQMVEQHGGTIELSSRQGHGSTFTIRLPLTPKQPGIER
jgi:PAS domain S-box-containing protein